MRKLPHAEYVQLGLIRDKGRCVCRKAFIMAMGQWDSLHGSLGYAAVQPLRPTPCNWASRQGE